ncbi:MULTISPECIES: YaaR family protein [unclassified Sporolactobacillus]|uniref:YaaR family protein n=1 Tax=unclassified Sporolactobacillus TaxID=2628533 RepID=UPI0023677B42|nr:YaaR family protein [Sporolactobacillus sp. CQH2019]MDD9150674.1 YaaR family protein [Sporolactobacillus sp. CQH2019]
MPIKISGETKINESQTGRGTAALKSSASFESTLSEKKQSLDADALKALLDKIDGQAQRVSSSRTIHDVQLYKQYVRSFMQEAVRTGLGTQQSRSWQQGGTKQQLVGIVDKKLIALTNDLLDKNKEGIDLLDRLGEIRGLLINLYV